MKGRKKEELNCNLVSGIKKNKTKNISLTLENTTTLYLRYYATSQGKQANSTNIYCKHQYLQNKVITFFFLQLKNVQEVILVGQWLNRWVDSVNYLKKKKSLDFGKRKMVHERSLCGGMLGAQSGGYIPKFDEMSQLYKTLVGWSFVCDQAYT